MAKRIPKAFLDDLIRRTDIVSLIGSKITFAKRSGDNHMACCPFHNEKTPSFSVSQSKQFYYCFGCGASGDALRFVMDYDHLTFVEAVESLAAFNGLTVPYEDNGFHEDPGVKVRLEKGLQCLADAVTYFHQSLYADIGKAARDYVRERQIKRPIVDRFEIGFSPANESIAEVLGKKYPLQLLQEVGLVHEKEGRNYDWFRNRLMFPIRNARGQIIGFGGRSMGDAQPKYLNSPETDWFNKRNELYGLHLALQARAKSLIVTEGYMDVVKLHQYEFDNAVASLGTAFGEAHLRQLKKRTRLIYFCFDGDAAGLKAAEKALKIVFSEFDEEHDYRFVFMPEGEDPDSLLNQRGHDAFQQYLNNSLRPSAFLERILDMDSREQWSVEKQAKQTQLAASWVGLLPQGNYRTLLQKSLEKDLAVQLVVTEAPLAINNPSQTRGDVYNARPRREMVNAPFKLEWRMLALLLQHPDWYRKVDDELVEKAIAKALPVFFDLCYLLRCGASPAMLKTAVVEAGLQDKVERAEEILAQMDGAQQAQEFDGVMASLKKRLTEKLARLEKLGVRPD